MYSEHKHDYPTKWGIRQEDLDSCECETPLPKLTRSEAYTIWYWKYWIKPNFNLLAEHSMLIAEEVFDTGVLAGPTRAVKMLQRQLNAFNYQVPDEYRLRYGVDLIVDGLCGPATARRLKAYLDHRNADPSLKMSAESILLIALNCLQHAFHVDISDGDSGRDLERRSFNFGWLVNRVVNDLPGDMR